MIFFMKLMIIFIIIALIVNFSSFSEPTYELDGFLINMVFVLLVTFVLGAALYNYEKVKKDLKEYQYTTKLNKVFIFPENKQVLDDENCNLSEFFSEQLNLTITNVHVVRNDDKYSLEISYKDKNEASKLPFYDYKIDFDVYGVKK